MIRRYFYIFSASLFILFTSTTGVRANIDDPKLEELARHTNSPPDGFNYQAVLRDSNGDPLASAAVTMRFTLSNSGGDVWIETHSTTTNAYGMVVLVIGNGTKTGGSAASFAVIDWSLTISVKVEADSGNGFANLGTNELQSVPYAKYAENGLSTAQETKLDALDGNAEQNVQADWNDADSGSDSFVQNKPSIPSDINELTDDDNLLSGGFDGSFNSLADVPANLDIDDTDDFDGAFGSLTGVPANLDTDATDDFDGAFGSLSGVPANLDTDDTDDVTQTTPPTGGSISGDFGSGLQLNPDIVTTVEIVDGSIVDADIGDISVTKINDAPNLDVDSTDDLLATSSPTGGDVSGDFSTGLVVDQVGGETAADIASAANIVNTAPSLDTDATDDLTTADLIFQNTTNVISAGDADDDFVFGSTQLADSGDPTKDNRMFFDKSLAAFRAGSASLNQWNYVGSFSFAAGQNNQASGSRSTISGGMENLAGDQWSTVSGGAFNQATGHASVIGGGYQNTASNQYATIGGGASNSASYSRATVGGGSNNQAAGNYATIAGGSDNVANQGATIGGGSNNQAAGNYATIAGGSDNVANQGSSVGGGSFNNAFGISSTIGGGANNNANQQFSTIAGGSTNTTHGTYSTVGGGYWNRSYGSYSTVAGGYQNRAEGERSVVGGGFYNVTSGSHAVIPGGANLLAKSFAETVIGTYNTDVTPNSATSFNANDRLFVVGNGTSSGARSDAMVVLKNGNTDINGSLVANSLGVDGQFTLPNTDGTAGQILATDGSGTVSWGDPASGGSGAFTLASNLISAGDADDDFVFGSTQLSNSGNASEFNRMFFDKSLGAFRAGSAQGPSWDNPGNFSFAAGLNTTASGAYSTVSGGVANTASYSISTVSGGYYNTASGLGATVGGGLKVNAQAYGEFAVGIFSANAASPAAGSIVSTDRIFTVGNGTGPGSESNALVILKNGNTDINGSLVANSLGVDGQFTLPTTDGGAGQVLQTDGSGNVTWQTASGGGSYAGAGTDSFVAGASNNAAAGNYSTVGGGYGNNAGGNYSTVGGGRSNGVGGSYRYHTVAGGRSNQAFQDYSTVGGGSNNTAFAFFSTVGGGRLNKAYGYYSSVGGGRDVKAHAFGEFAIGLFSEDAISPTASSFVATDRIFTLGNGTSSGARSNAITVLKNGNTTLNGQLTIDADNAGALPGFTLPGQDGTAGQILSTDGAGTVGWTSVAPTIVRSTGATITIPDDIREYIFSHDGSQSFTVTLPSSSTAGDKILISLNDGSNSPQVTFASSPGNLLGVTPENWAANMSTNNSTIELIYDGVTWIVASGTVFSFP